MPRPNANGFASQWNIGLNDIFLKAQSGPQYSIVVTDVLKRDFPYCDVAR